MERRNTIQRELVLQTVRALRSHATAEEIYAQIISNYPSVGKGTVYRNLKLLAQEGKIRLVCLPGEPDRYDHITQAHYHVRCLGCGRIFDVDMAPVPGLLEQIRDKKGMEFLDYEILFTGLCPACQNNGGKS